MTAMFCTTCIAERRPAKGSHVPHFCDACGFPLTGTGTRTVRPTAAVMVALGEVYGDKTKAPPQHPPDAMLEAFRRMARP